MQGLPLILTILLALTLAACGEEKQQSAATAPPPVEVDVALPLKQTLTEWDEFTGQFEALARVDVRARITGYLVEKRFKDGQFVKRGDILFIIDQRLFKYEVERAEAQYSLAQKTYQRAEDLRQSQSISQELFEQRWQELKVAEVVLNEAKLNLEFTQVKAANDGKISRSFVDTGNLVSANDTILTRIVTVNPIHFVFDGSQGELLKYLRMDRSGERPSSDTNPNPIVIKLLDEDTYIHKGRVDFLDNIVDPGTSTITARALVENNDGIIYPGFFGRARLIGRSAYEATLLPERSINTDQNRKYVYVIGPDNKTKRNYITPGLTLNNGFIVIKEGLNGDERVVVNSIQRIRKPNQLVTPLETPLQWVELNDVPDISTVPSLAAIAAKANTEASTNASE